MRKVRDQQRSKVYTWENTFCPKFGEGERLTLKDCGTIISKAVKHYGLSMPRVGDGRGCRRATYAAYKYTINLPCWARSPEVTLHETAHLITGNLFRGAPAHGREFVGVYMYLLSRYAGHDIKTLAKTANEYGVDFASAVACKPRK